MLEKLLGLLQGAMPNPFQGFLGELWKVWTQDAGRAVLLARWYWRNLPADLAQQAARVQQQAQDAQVSSQIDQQINAQLGALGISPSYSNPSAFGLGMNPDHALFIIVMGTIRAHQGDPPASGDMAQLAEAVLRGTTDPLEALLATAPAFTRSQLAVAIQTLKMMGMDHLLRLQAVIGAASALPRDRISALVPGIAGA